MLITKENIGRLKIGQKVWKASFGFNMVTRYYYLGIIDFEGQQKHVFSNPNDDMESISFNQLSDKDDIVKKSFCTDREEACNLMRTRSILLIDHFNKHEFKNNPIIYETI